MGVLAHGILEENVADIDDEIREHFSSVTPDVINTMQHPLNGEDFKLRLRVAQLMNAIGQAKQISVESLLPLLGAEEFWMREDASELLLQTSNIDTIIKAVPTFLPSQAQLLISFLTKAREGFHTLTLQDGQSFMEILTIREDDNSLLRNSRIFLFEWLNNMRQKQDKLVV